MSFSYSRGTSAVERILRIYFGNISIGTTSKDSFGTSDIRQYVQDSELYINARLEDTISSIPSPAPSSLIFAADYMAAYLAYCGVFAANKPDEPSPVVLSWKDMAEKVISSYKGGYINDANVAAYTSATKIFNTKGIIGIGDGELKDIDDVKDHRIS